MITRYCKECEGRTPMNKAENRKDSPYICEGCETIHTQKELKEQKISQA